MKKDFLIKNALYLTMLILLFLFACEQKDDPEIEYPDYKINEYLYQLMKVEKWYYWVDSMPDIKPNNYLNPDTYLNMLLFQKYDKWSFFTDYSTYVAVFKEGKYEGYGFLPLADENGDVRVAFIFKNSPFGRAGIKRGYIIKSINGYNAKALYQANTFNKFLEEQSTHNFQLIDDLGNIIYHSLSKTEITQNTVLHYSVININTKTIGYFVFNSFIDPSFDELDELFSYFKTMGVTDLIMDLRYNGGGSVAVANFLGNLIAGKKAEGQIFNVTKYNHYKDEFSTKEFFKIETNSLDINSLVAITSDMSASASELVINSLQPVIDVKVVGTPSHGKPVGMRLFFYKNIVAAPVTFKSVNAEGKGDYFNGLPVDGYSQDGLDKDFGDTTEACLKQALNYFRSGTFATSSPSLKSLGEKQDRSHLKGIRRQIGAY